MRYLHYRFPKMPWCSKPLGEQFENLSISPKCLTEIWELLIVFNKWFCFFLKCYIILWSEDEKTPITAILHAFLQYINCHPNKWPNFETFSWVHTGFPRVKNLYQNLFLSITYHWYLKQTLMKQERTYDGSTLSLTVILKDYGVKPQV